MNTKIRLIAVDMDGTLVNDKKEIPEEFFDWVPAHPQVHVVIASGRPYYTNYQLFERIADKMIFIGDNGGIIYAGGKIIYQNALTKEEVAQCLSLLKDEKLAEPILCAAEKGICRHPGNDKEYEKQVHTYFTKYQYTDDLNAAAEDNQIIKIATYIREKKAAEVSAKITEWPEAVNAVLGGPEWIDLVHKDVNKGAALKKLQEILGISKEETMAFGDYLNDLTMLKEAGESYAMANSHPTILRIARHTAPSNNYKGVMRILNQKF